MSKATKIRESIKAQILNGELLNGEQLLPLRQLAEIYNVSYLTMSHALDQLEQENLITRVHGRGVFINYTPAKFPSQKYRVLVIYHAGDAITPLFLDKLLNFFCSRHAELTLFEISFLDSMLPKARAEKISEYLNLPADLLIVDGSYYLPFKEIDKFRTNFKKIVFFNRYESNLELTNAAKILYDYKGAGLCVAKALLENNRKRVLYIAPDSKIRRSFPPFGPQETYHNCMREGLAEGLKDSGTVMQNLITTPKKLLHDTEKIIDSFKPDAIFVFHDYAAAKIFHLLHKRNIKIGKQTDVIGCFDTPIGQAWLEPALSTINFNADRMLKALENFLSAHEENFKVMISPQLIRRDSMRSPKNISTTK